MEVPPKVRPIVYLRYLRYCSDPNTPCPTDGFVTCVSEATKVVAVMLAKQGDDHALLLVLNKKNFYFVLGRPPPGGSRGRVRMAVFSFDHWGGRLRLGLGSVSALLTCFLALRAARIIACSS